MSGSTADVQVGRYILECAQEEFPVKILTLHYNAQQIYYKVMYHSSLNWILQNAIGKDYDDALSQNLNLTLTEMALSLI